MLKVLALTLALSLTVMASPAAAARVAVLMSAKVSEYEEALKGFKESTPHQVAAVYDMDGDLDRRRTPPRDDYARARVLPDPLSPRLAAAPLSSKCGPLPCR